VASRETALTRFACGKREETFRPEERLLTEF